MVTNTQIEITGLIQECMDFKHQIYRKSEIKIKIITIVLIYPIIINIQYTTGL